VLITKRPIRVWSDSPLIPEYLKRPEFAHVEKEDQADIIWLATSEFADWLRLGGRFISQLPGEACVCMKHELMRTVRKAFGQPAWLPETFDLTTELPEFVARFREREAAGRDNHWIVKPFNAARGIEIAISKDLSFLVRQADGVPKIASKYLERPCTLSGRKFDLRFLVYARCKEGWAAPEFYAFKTFWVRFGTNTYELKNLWDYGTHFTVQNYKNPAQMIHMKWPEFVTNFEKEHGVAWAGVRMEIDHMMGRVFQAATLCEIGGGETCSANCVGVYGVDLLLTHDFHPVLEEVNWSPDCTRACKYDPDFYNKTFGHFFLGEMPDVTRIF
jgi:tubulin--tyrosine ligase-like protein 12